MKMLDLDNEYSNYDNEQLQQILLTKVVKIRKLNKEMKDNVAVQKAEDMLAAAKAPYKRTGSRWRNEIETIELELKKRNIKFSIKQDDILID